MPPRSRAPRRRPSSLRTWRHHWALPCVAAAAILVLDAVAQARTWPLVVRGLLDEPAHVLTAWVVVAALAGYLPRTVALWALVAAVAIDVDHVPLYLSDYAFAADGGRPPTHSLGVAAALLLVAALPRAPRAALAGAALGVLLHLCRDLATGPGVALTWPFQDTAVVVPYEGYVVAVALVAGIASGRRLRRARRARSAEEPAPASPGPAETTAVAERAVGTPAVVLVRLAGMATRADGTVHGRRAPTGRPLHGLGGVG